MNIQREIENMDLSPDGDTETNLKIYAKYIRKLKLEDIVTTNSVFMSSMRCACGFRNRRDTQKFLAEHISNCCELKDRVLEGKFRPKYYATKYIKERGKVREIKPPVFESKVIQKLLADWLIRPILEQEMIKTSYASIKNRRTAKMYADINRAVNSEIKNKDGYIIMTDFKSYFPSIDMHILRRMFEERIEDKRIVDLIMLFSPGEKGLSLGNELSQIPASFYPTELDKKVRGMLRHKNYYRYMDDILFIVQDEAEYDEAMKVMNEMCNKLKLELKYVKKIRMRKDFEFCKERFRYDKRKDKYFRLCNKRIFTSERSKIKLFGKMLTNNEIERKYVEDQYKAVHNSIASRKNTHMKLERLQKYYENEIEKS